MLKFAEFDIKTNRPILKYDPITQGQAQSYKEVDMAYLQHWLKARGLERAPLYTADFYQGINPSDNQRLLKQGKHVIFTGGTSGKYVSAYFTDAATAQAILIGNEREPPLYELGDKSAHYAVAYGSLPISDCHKDAIVKGGKGRSILIVDDEAQSVGSEPIFDRDGNPVRDLSDLLSKMGDGTMLLPTGLMRELLLEKEVQTIIRRSVVRVASVQRERTDRDLNEELGVVGEWLDEVTGDKVEDELVALIAAEYRANGRIGTSHVPLNTAKTINKLLDRAADESVIQFRAAITDTPGMFKGMMKTSKWCERLGVAAIVSKNCIKGNGVDLDTVGMLELNKGSTLWVGRKEVATWGEQSVGMQVKICIPTATERELNPIAFAKAGRLAEIAVDPYLLGQKYVEDDRRKKSNLAIAIDDNGEVSGQVRQKDALADLLALDVNGELTQMPTIQRRLTEALRCNWVDAATSGVEVPSAVAQHHGKLDVWEICNRKLPHGAVVAWYRSPVPNVSAFAFGINNLDLKDVDPESYNKRGVVYVNPWTAKEIAISDFDGDRFGQFVGYVAKDPAAFMAQMREVVAAYESPSRRYEAFHAALEQSIELGTDFERGTFPLSIDELAVATSLEQRPQQIKKAEKVAHEWNRQNNQPISEAIFTTWTNVAANPISKVANLGMNLQMLAANAINTPASEKAALLDKIGREFEKLRNIPSDDTLINAGLPALDLAVRIERIKLLSKELPLQKVTPESTQFIAQGLAQVATILKDYAEYPVASQLQIAVDSLKSRTGINNSLFNFGQALCYQQNEVREQLKADWVYSTDKSPPRGLSTVLPANTYEPIGEHVRAVNDIFESVLEAQRDIKIGRENLNAAFRQIVPLSHNSQDSSMVDSYVSQYRAARDIMGVAAARQKEQRPEDKQPTLTITSANSGKTFEVHRTIQAQNKNTVNKNRVWELAPNQTYRFSIEANPTARADPYLVNLIDPNDNKIAILGSTTHEMLELGNFDLVKLDEAISQRGLVKLQGRVELHPPRTLINDTDRHKAVMTQVLANLKATISPEREDAALSAIWYGNQSTDRRVRNSSAGMSIVTKILPDRLGTYLGVKRTLDLGYVTEYGGILADANTTLDLRIDNLIKKEGTGAVPMVSAILPDGSTVALGSILKSAPPPPPGSILAGTVTRKVRDIDIVVGGEKRKVVPTAELADVSLIDRANATFAFKMATSGVEVTAIRGESQIVLGTLVPKSRDLNNIIPTSNQGSYERTFHTHQIEVHVREFVAHQPVSDILSGNPVRLPDREINPHLPLLHRPEPSPPERYLPNRAELVSWYKAAISTNNADDTQYLIQVGQQLKTAYLNEPFMQGHLTVERLPDNYQNSAVSVAMEDKQRLDLMSNRANEPLQQRSNPSRGR